MLGPAQLTVQVTVNQATASAPLEATGPATQERTISTTTTVTNADDGAQATVVAMTLFGVLLVGENPQDFEVVHTPPPPFNIIPPGGTQVYNVDIPIETLPPYFVAAGFDLFEEIDFTDALGETRRPAGCAVNLFNDLVDKCKLFVGNLRLFLCALQVLIKTKRFSDYLHCGQQDTLQHIRIERG